jgi:hypothetical protein
MEQLQALVLVEDMRRYQALLEAVVGVGRRRADLEQVCHLDELVLAEDGDAIRELVSSVLNSA